MKAVIGLGNPGIEYKGTRHNAGFEVIDRLCSLTGIDGSLKLSKRFFADIATATLVTDVLLVRPITYMNDSGKAVQAIKSFYKVSLKDLLIIHDDVSLPLGKIRLQGGGGAGGQHGIESIIEHLGGEKGFNRLKIGIGPDPGGDVRHQYVLQKFSGEERILLNKVIEQAYEATFRWITSGIEEAMNEFNGLDLRD